MSHQFKPGDLALTLAPIGDEAPAGCEVELIQFFPEGTDANFQGIEFVAECDLWVVRLHERFAAFGVKHLMPLRDDFAPEQQKTKEAV
ncbi:hypothetical protein BK645_10000 [Pseudomonas protegens]|uniref:hypothetical protein n=1 Tax=Pseudomonas protegens TaxID=380021 RepID=UPI00037516C4|nr:hypothetical protein [Pseudomonas protegens]ROM29292.1 hypothetical protein BK645_10000 [Pseudomonas protegens]ROM36925.1 hypothetical protein BK646_18045 [Pseudomonas protegens]